MMKIRNNKGLARAVQFLQEVYETDDDLALLFAPAIEAADRAAQVKSEPRKDREPDLPREGCGERAAAENSIIELD